MLVEGRPVIAELDEQTQILISSLAQPCRNRPFLSSDQMNSVNFLSVRMTQ